MNVAVVGLGWWGRRIIASLASSDVVAVVAVTDPSAEARASVRGLVPMVCETFEEALATPGIDGVILCSPHRFHAEQMIAAAKAGLHVFCEKPFSTDVAEAQAALAAIEEAGLTVGIGHERRFEPAIQRLREMVLRGDLGKPVLFEATFSHDKFLALPPDNWRLSPVEAPVGPLSATGIHLMDLAISIFGQPVDVCAQLRSEQFANGDTLAVSLSFPGGESALISAVLVTPFIARLCLYCTNGWVEIRDRTHPEDPTGWDVVTRFKGEDPLTEFIPAFPAVAANIEAWARAAQGGDDYPVPPREILANVKTFEAITRSATTGEAVRLA